MNITVGFSSTFRQSLQDHHTIPWGQPKGDCTLLSFSFCWNCHPKKEQAEEGLVSCFCCSSSSKAIPHPENQGQCDDFHWQYYIWSFVTQIQAMDEVWLNSLSPHDRPHLVACQHQLQPAQMSKCKTITGSIIKSLTL